MTRNDPPERMDGPNLQAERELASRIQQLAAAVVALQVEFSALRFDMEALLKSRVAIRFKLPSGPRSSIYRDPEIRACLLDLADSTLTIAEIKDHLAERFPSRHIPGKSAIGVFLKRVRLTLESGADLPK